MYGYYGSIYCLIFCKMTYQKVEMKYDDNKIRQEQIYELAFLDQYYVQVGR